MSTFNASRPSRVSKLKEAMVSDNRTCQLNIMLPKELHKKVKKKATDLETTITKLVISYFHELVNK